jgi:hypothetical protein
LCYNGCNEHDAAKEVRVVPRMMDLGVGARYRAYTMFHHFLDEGKGIEDAIRLMLDHYPTMARDEEFLDYIRGK